MGFISSYLPSMMVWGCGAGSCAMVRLPALPINGAPYDVASGQRFVQFMCLPGAYTGASLPRRLQNCFKTGPLNDSFRGTRRPSAGRLVLLAAVERWTGLAAC